MTENQKNIKNVEEKTVKGKDAVETVKVYGAKDFPDSLILGLEIAGASFIVISLVLIVWFKFSRRVKK